MHFHSLTDNSWCKISDDDFCLDVSEWHSHLHMADIWPLLSCWEELRCKIFCFPKRYPFSSVEKSICPDKCGTNLHVQDITISLIVWWLDTSANVLLPHNHCSFLLDVNNKLVSFRELKRRTRFSFLESILALHASAFTSVVPFMLFKAWLSSLGHSSPGKRDMWVCKLSPYHLHFFLLVARYSVHMTAQHIRFIISKHLMDMHI